MTCLNLSPKYIPHLLKKNIERRNNFIYMYKRKTSVKNRKVFQFPLIAPPTNTTHQVTHLPGRHAWTAVRRPCWHQTTHVVGKGQEVKCWLWSGECGCPKGDMNSVV